VTFWLKTQDANWLDALIGMYDSALLRCFAVQRHAERVSDEKPGLAAVDRPADDHA
jgi:hypothetical protein